MKNKILMVVAFIIGAITFGTLGVYASESYNAKYMNYTDSNNNVKTVNVVLDELHTKASVGINFTHYDLIDNHNTPIDSTYSFTPSSDYLFYVVNDIRFSGATGYLQYNSNRTDIKSITNASYYVTGYSGTDYYGGSGAARSWIVIPTDPPNQVSITFAGDIDAVSVYGVK